MKNRIFLSPPHMGGQELGFVGQAFESNYIAPLGPMVDAFEREFGDYVGIGHCAAVSSGTAAMHLALRHLGVGLGDEVFASTLTFIGGVTPVVFQGARPVFIDCERDSWNMDPVLLEEELARCAGAGCLPKAVVPTDLYGQCCDYGRVFAVCESYGVPVVVDAAEAVGARYRNAEGESDGPSGSGLWLHAGVGARAAVFSFNGNKIITTSGGGMLASDDGELIAHARKLSQQAREDVAHYEHVEIGYNYRMSNVVAAIGRGQLGVIEERVQRKRVVFDYYEAALGGVPGIGLMPEPGWSRSNRWLTVITVDEEAFGASREDIREALAREDIEARPVWKPMHLQPVFDARITQVSVDSKGRTRYPCRVVGGGVAEELFEKGLCLPSGTVLTNQDLDRIIDRVEALGAKA
ncbi:MAG: DegT/DnrJ/EryC1/StrS family aminotransferase [Deltaproteobacteria bacterium]|nr:DegT/DnrJ/EryC1/StrS family aminotransferase [Deltaproteobacteria bacterium]